MEQTSLGVFHPGVPWRGGLPAGMDEPSISCQAVALRPTTGLDSEYTPFRFL